MSVDPSSRPTRSAPRPYRPSPTRPSAVARRPLPLPARQEQPKTRPVPPVDRPLSKGARWLWLGCIFGFSTLCILIAIFMPEFKALIH